MELKGPNDLFSLSLGDVITKRNLFDLIQYSKVPGSAYWGGDEMQIWNTPQQGINWVGKPPACHAIIIKTRPGSYDEDGWVNNEKSIYHYSFKAKNDVISYSEKANAVLINQPQFHYPIFLFTESKASWIFEGAFSISAIENKHVVLERGFGISSEQLPSQEEIQYQEGGRKYVTHLMAERSSGVVKDLKDGSAWVCDICSLKFVERYQVDYIEAHHKTPISSFSSAHTITQDDFCLLCPNCHKATHIYMKKGLEYLEIKKMLSGMVPKQ